MSLLLPISTERYRTEQVSKSWLLEGQRALTRFNRNRLSPGLGEEHSNATKLHHRHMLDIERTFLMRAREAIAPLLKDIPSEGGAFIDWFESLKQNGPGQNDPLFPWLANTANFEQMRWFLEQEVAGEAGFDDLVAMTQVKMPVRAKLEMARNYWDEMGRGDPKGMHGPMLDSLAAHFGIKSEIETTELEALALGNMMTALATNRTYAFHSIGALGVIEMTAPGRAALVTLGLNRLGVPRKVSHYFALHAVLDVRHSASWNSEVLQSLVEEDPRRAKAIAEGALLRLWCGQACFIRYRAQFGLTAQ
jgi:Iron-containing redox enzyme